MSLTAGNPKRAYWLKTLHEWHWISSAVCLLGLLLFAVTGITLNHSEQIDSAPRISEQRATVPAPLLQQLAALGAAAEEQQYTPAPPPALRSWIQDTFSVDVAAANGEWSAREVYLSMQRPGGDGWVSISLRNGTAKHQDTDRGWIAYLNDLHKGRYTGTAWAWFIDIVAAACLVFAVTGLFILKMHAGNRPATWPLVGFGILVPALIALLFIH
jgi:uncharacterized protein